MGGVADHGPVAVGNIGNYYGGLSLKREGGIDYWSIENWDGDHWSEVPAHVGDALRSIISADELDVAEREAALATQRETKADSNITGAGK